MKPERTILPKPWNDDEETFSELTCSDVVF